MYARVTLLEIDTVRVDIADALAQYEERVMPELQSQPGYAGLLVMQTPEGRAIIASALGTGDTVGLTIRSSVLTSLGNTDEVVSVKTAGVDLPQAAGQASDTGYFPEPVFDDVAKAVKGSTAVDGVAPAIIES